MSILVDKQLNAKINSNPPQLITNSTSSEPIKVRGCSIDLRIGYIYRPGTSDRVCGSADKPFEMDVVLHEGETAIIETAETIKLDNQHAGFVFPSSRISIQGLLMTNPGHIDPGYEGTLQVTVINMGSKPFSLNVGSTFLRAFIHRLREPPVSRAPKSSKIKQELLDKLSPDFLSVNERSNNAAKRQVKKSDNRSYWLQICIPAVAVLATAYITYYTAQHNYGQRISALEKAAFSDRIKELELAYPLQDRLRNIENSLKIEPKEKIESGPEVLNKP